MADLPYEIPWYVVNIDKTRLSDFYDRLGKWTNFITSVKGFIYKNILAIPHDLWNIETTTINRIGHIGCSHSHAHFWTKIVNEKIPFAFIMEDTINLTPDSIDALKDVYQIALKESFDILFVSKNMSGYLLTYTGAQKLLKNWKPIKVSLTKYVYDSNLSKISLSIYETVPHQSSIQTSKKIIHPIPKKKPRTLKRINRGRRSLRTKN